MRPSRRETRRAPRKAGRSAPGRDRAGQGRKAPPRRSFLGWALRGLVSAAAIVALAGGLFAAYVATTLPATDDLFAVQGEPSVTFVDVQGRVIAKRGAGASRLVELAELPPYLPQAILAIEDRRFYEHVGLDVWGLARAAFANVEAGRVVQGGSTLTQQLAKNLFLTPARTYERKAQEAMLAIWLEMKFSKDQILTLYLNRVFFGAGYGVEAAARRYFGKSASQVTLAEAATLAGLLKAPSRINPQADPDAAHARMAVVLDSMVDAGFIAADEAEAAKRAPVAVAAAQPNPSSSYFADWAMDRLGDLAGRPATDWIVETTLDLDMQAEADRIVAGRLEAEGAKLRAGQAALVALSPDGAIRAMAGGRDYRASQFNRATQAKRPPGSAFKPFVFLAALEAGYGPDSVMLDAPISLRRWNPSNYKREYEGEVTLTRAFARSLNSVAIRLILDVQPQAVVDVARRFGVASPLTPQPALALGASETNLLELTGAYAAFANGGLKAEPYAIVRIATRSGRLIWERDAPAPVDVMSPANAAAMAAMMRATVEAGTGTKAKLSDRPAAGKTGTSQDFRDAWFVGFTRGMVAGVWVGNDDNSKMKNVTGGALPAAIWHDFMEANAARSEAGELVALEFGSDPGWSETPMPGDPALDQAPDPESDPIGALIAGSDPLPAEGGQATITGAISRARGPEDADALSLDDQAAFGALLDDVLAEEPPAETAGAGER